MDTSSPPQILETAQVATSAEVLPFRRPTVIDQAGEVLSLLQTMIDRIKAGERITGLAMICVDAGADIERSYVMSAGLRRMEIIGNLFACATELTIE